MREVNCPVCHNRTRMRFLAAWKCGNCLSKLRLSSWHDVPHWSFTPLLLLLPMLRKVEVVERSPLACRKCGYNLTGNESGICPECGEPIPSEQAEPGDPSD